MKSNAVMIRNNQMPIKKKKQKDEKYMFANRENES